MFKTKDDLSEETRAKVVEMRNGQVAGLRPAMRVGVPADQRRLILALCRRFGMASADGGLRPFRIVTASCRRPTFRPARCGRPALAAARSTCCPWRATVLEEVTGR
jgi:hypothetical protein